jgi:NADPH-dependent curcumin reductase CurA
MSQALYNQQFQLAARPHGEITPSDFTLVDTGVPEPGEGEILVRVEYLALEPAMKGWMEARVDYVAPVNIGDVMRGGGAGTVIASNNARFPEGSRVSGQFGWRRFTACEPRAAAVRQLPDDIALPQAMNVLGITGLTAYFGMLDIGAPQPGETVLVSGAAGATGSVAGQLARIAGARAVGIAGGAEKCAWLVDELGFDAAVDYKTGDTAAQVAAHCPQGVDVFFDNVGGEILDIALNNIGDGARVVLCGGISRYNETGPLPGPVNYFNLIYRRARMEGFIVLDYVERFPAALHDLLGHLRRGELQSRETITEGFERLPEALIALFRGGNIGKQLVKVDT